MYNDKNIFENILLVFNIYGRLDKNFIIKGLVVVEKKALLITFDKG